MAEWNKDIEFGNKAEEMVRRWFGGELGHNDILVIEEIKNNWHGGNLCIEEDSVLEQNKKGWVYTTEANCVIFVDYENEQAIAIETSELKKTYMQLKENYPLKTQITEHEGASWTSTHRFIPFNKFSYTFLKFHQRSS